MELEHLKTIWREATQAEIEGYFVSREEVQRLIRKRSNTMISQIKRKIRNKIFMAGGIGLLLLVFASYVFIAEEPLFDFFDSFSNSGSNLEAGIFYFVFGLVVCFISAFNAFSYRKILNIEKRKSDLKSSIKNILTIVKNAMKVKIYSDALVVPCTVIALVVIDLVRGIGLFPNVTTLLLFALGAVAFAFFSFQVSKYGQKQRYGKQIQMLEEGLEELQENHNKYG